MSDEAIRDLRRRIDAGEQVSNEEILAALETIRSARLNAAAPKPAPSKGPRALPKISIDLSDLFSKKHT